MSWEVRKRGRQYYTRSRRVGGRVVREYVGCGRIAELAARVDNIKREERKLEAAELASIREVDAELDGLIARICQLADVLGRFALMDAGYHNHRGQWRRRREKA